MQDGAHDGQHEADEEGDMEEDEEGEEEEAAYAAAYDTMVAANIHRHGGEAFTDEVSRIWVALGVCLRAAWGCKVGLCCEI